MRKGDVNEGGGLTCSVWRRQKTDTATVWHTG